MVCFRTLPHKYYRSLLAPSLPPEDFLVTEVTSTSIYLSWDLPSKSGRNGIVRSYIVKKIQVNNGVTTYHNATTSTFTATSLHPYYVYNFSVAAVTVATGVFSDVLSVTTDEEGMYVMNYYNDIIFIFI